MNAFDPTSLEGVSNGISTIGFALYLNFAASGAAWSYGEWAVTAP